MASLLETLQTKKKVPSSSSSSSSIDKYQLWTEKYRPRSIKDVLVACHSKKVNDLRDWLVRASGTKAAPGENSTSDNSSPLPMILVMGGCSGNGKSTMLELLCDELNIERTCWTFDMWESDFSSSGYSTNDSTSKLEQLDDFVTRSAYPRLNLTHSYPDSSSSGRSSDSNLGKRNAYGGRKSEKEAVNGYNGSTIKGRIIVVEDPPHLVGCSEQNQEMLMNRLLDFRDPIVMIMSEEDARDDMHGCLSRYLPLKILNKINLAQLFCPQITELKVKKVLESIIKEERIRKTDQISSIISQISESCLGDLRHAINHLQFVLGQNSSAIKHPICIQGGTRDISVSSLHSVSKLLAARLDESGSMSIAPDLVIESSDFPPDIIISFLQSNCIKNLQRAAGLSCHVQGPDQSGNLVDSGDLTISHIADVFSDFSDIDVWWFRQYDASKLIDHSDIIFPVSYCTAVASRSCAIAKGVGEAERQEAAKKAGLKAPLAPVYRPKILDGRQQIKNRKTNLLNLRNALATYVNSSSNSPICRNFCDVRQLAVTDIPYMSLFNQRERVVNYVSRDRREQPNFSRVSYFPSSISARVLALGNSQFSLSHQHDDINNIQYHYRNESSSNNRDVAYETGSNLEIIEDIEEFDE